MLLRIRPNLELGARVPHRLGKKMPDGSYLISHPFDCECFILHSLQHAPHVSYQMGHGRLFCDHCKTEEFAPCPGRRVSLLSREIVMDPSAVASDLKRFQVQHEDCPKPSVVQVSDGSAGVAGSPGYGVENLLSRDPLAKP